MKTSSLAKIITLPLLVLVTIVESCSAPAEKKDEAQALPPAHTATFLLAKGSLATSLKIPAELIAYKQVDIYAKVNSYVKNLNADIGTSVRSGQLLATLEAPELIAQVAAAESKYKSQEAIFQSSDATYQRVLETSKTPGTISKNDVDIAAAKRNSDLAQLQAAKADFRASSTIMEYLTIRAPFDGIISARNVNLGAYIGPSGKGSELPIFTLQELTHLRLVVAVPEAYKSYIKLNDVVSFTVKAYPGQQFSAKIARMSGVMDSQLRSEHIELDVTNTDLKLSPGMVAEASIAFKGGDNAYVVPKTAVVNSAEGIFLVEDVNGKAVKLPIRKGRETDSLTEVFGDNLVIGNTYVKKASEEMHSGSALN
jgi:membrane fusion protein (multidrug efflux system)